MGESTREVARANPSSLPLQSGVVSWPGLGKSGKGLVTHEFQADAPSFSLAWFSFPSPLIIQGVFFIKKSLHYIVWRGLMASLKQTTKENDMKTENKINAGKKITLTDIADDLNAGHWDALYYATELQISKLIDANRIDEDFSAHHFDYSEEMTSMTRFQ